MLDSWNDGPAKEAITDFVRRVATPDGPDFVAPEGRVAVFDNDGTLWCEKPAYIQLDFLVRRLAEQASADEGRSLRDTQPYRAAVDGDLAWFDDAVTKHYRGDDSALSVLAETILRAFEGFTVEEHAERVRRFFADAMHPSLNRPYRACGYAPMVELLRFLEANAFATYIVSGGGRDFMRPVTPQLYGLAPERVIGSSVGLDYRDGQLRTTSRPEFLDDGPVKPVRIWGRTGRRPILAVGNSNGDIEMLEYAHGSRPALCMLVCHDDADREFAYAAGAERAGDLAREKGWTVVSMRGDWRTVFGD
ncbi:MULTISPECIES: HAD family hydrolase [Mycobacterium]|uniref:Acid phosphatase n=1 Tax=Mycobacterium kiyosense TaxID=2871094 RepID=A0A9P3UZ91_9MYCO|nr:MULTISPECIES: HAD family hydrolase [Mycobacterium]BDB40332.1 acid phosphatase [Mycobacterium kiyosense]BDE12152.1 acid phosphatase [Mycobacterium sp. 20KCMC460]GLB86760.1 acid phosphatase [Mycobacterium kiyosense]GLB88693.1 acid phosphatase [Mycobacterium kiyosense]GLB95037.1 acid phosphatase [Mycobacterium kiyosense]